MAKAVIDFHEIFLFGIRNDSLTVLAPAKGHQSFFSGPQVPRTRLTNHVITLLKDREPARGTLIPETEPYMVNLDDVLGKDAYRMKQLEQLERTLVSARFELGGSPCWLQGMSMAVVTGDESYILKEWAFGKYFSHMLTNRARFVVDLDGGKYEFKIDDLDAGSSTTVPVNDGDMFLAQSADVPAFSARNATPRTSLDEFELFYELLDSKSGSAVRGPVPTADAPPKQKDSQFNLFCIRPGCPNAVCHG